MASVTSSTTWRAAVRLAGQVRPRGLAHDVRGWLAHPARRGMTFQTGRRLSLNVLPMVQLSSLGASGVTSLPIAASMNTVDSGVCFAPRMIETIHTGRQALLTR